MGVFLPMRRLDMTRRIWLAIKKLGREWDVIHYHGHLPMLGALVPAQINFIHTLHDQGGECITKIRIRNGMPCAALDPAVCAGCATSRPNAVQTAISAYAVRHYRTLATKAFTRHQAICVSGFIEKRLREVLTSGQGLRTFVIHNFIDHDGINRAKSVSIPAGKISDKSLNIFMAGRIDQSKGFGALLAAIPVARFAEMRIRIAGDGPDLANLRARYGSVGVEFLGWRDHDAILEDTFAADVCVVPSICEEACATTILEALALGAPVFALKRGGTPELHRYERFAGQLQLFPDLESLAQALLSRSFVSPHATGADGVMASVRDRLPEILDVYTKGTEHVKALRGN